MNADKKFEPITEGEIVKEFGFTDEAGNTHTGVIIKREVESDIKTKKYDWIAQIEGYEFVECKFKKSDAVEALDEEVKEIGNRTPAQHKYGQSLRDALNDIDYHFRYILRYFESAHADLEKIKQKFAETTRPHELAGLGEDAALNSSLIWLGDDFRKYVESSKVEHADNVLDFVERLEVVVNYYKEQATYAVTQQVIRPGTGHFDDRFHAQAYAYFIGRGGNSISNNAYHLAEIDKAFRKIGKARLELALAHERPNVYDHFTTNRAGEVWAFYKVAEVKEEAKS